MKHTITLPVRISADVRRFKLPNGTTSYAVSNVSVCDCGLMEPVVHPGSKVFEDVVTAAIAQAAEQDHDREVF